MIVRTIEEIDKSDAAVKAPTFISRRMLLAKDGMGFSFHDTTLFAGSETLIWYKNHLEAVYCIEGEGELEVLPDGPTYPIRPGTMYALNGNEKHMLRAKTQFRMICVFNPPLTGGEVHDEEGVYPLLIDQPDAPAQAVAEAGAQATQ
ncbi:ectoine synthase [Planctomycetales bacterium ZRK34]|nr:ectoine synthase [Planctomycetales bacterium ZRK34]